MIAGIRDLEPELAAHPFLGKGKITVSDMRSRPEHQRCSDEATIYIDRRMTFGETKEEAIAQIERLIPEADKDKIPSKLCTTTSPPTPVLFFQLTSTFSLGD